MKSLKKKKLPIIMAASALVVAAAGFGLMGHSATLASADTPNPGPNTITQKDYFGNNVKITVEYVDDTYYLADFTRNIYVYNGNNDSNPNDLINGIGNLLPYASTTGEFEPIAVSVFYNLVAAYDFYNEENLGFDWKGINNGNDDVWGNLNDRRDSEYPIYAFTHVNYSSYERQNTTFNYYDDLKASWIFVGDGFVGSGTPARTLSHQGAALDILAHEYHHGITKFLSKGLAYSGESGALDEAFSDIFGLLVAGADKNLSPDVDAFWEFGADGTVAGDALRSFKNPPYYYQYSSRYVCNSHAFGQHDNSCDNGGVHYNSMIASYVQYAACKKLPGYFTIENIAQLWIETIKTIPANATLIDFAEKIRTAAANLNFSEEAQQAIADALDESGYPKTYKVTFQYEDGTVIGTDVVREGNEASIAARPSKPSTNQYYYTFTGWDKDVSSVHEDMVVTALFDESLREYVVKFVMDDGTVISQSVLTYGSEIVPPADPQKASDDEYSYTFAGWDGLAETVTGNLTITAIFEAHALKTPDEEKPDKDSSGCGTVNPTVGGISGGIGGGLALLTLGGALLAITTIRKKSDNQ